MPKKTSHLFRNFLRTPLGLVIGEIINVSSDEPCLMVKHKGITDIVPITYIVAQLSQKTTPS